MMILVSFFSPPPPKTKKNIQTKKQRSLFACPFKKHINKQTKQARKRREEVGLKRRGAWFFV
jgi:hypothetical protein